MSLRKPWERRLKDLSQILDNCSSTYFEPNLFRMNLNNFLQTSRTVTFIIQKNKHDIPDFDKWYQDNALSKWSNDVVMTWAKDSRNKIEKEGDLEMLSSLRATLIFSYLNEEDIELDCVNNGLLFYSVKKLCRFAQQYLPTSVSDAAVIKIERRWVANSLPSWELLHALGYIYCRLYDCCKLLGSYLSVPISNEIRADDIDSLREKSRNIEFVKIRGMESHRIHTEEVSIDRDFEPSKEIKEQIISHIDHFNKPKSLKQSVEQFSETAKATFDYFGNHDQMLFMLDSNWNVINMVTTVFEDQAEKYIFWRSIGDTVKTLDVYTLIWISEAWIRDPNKNKYLPIRNMPITGEKLQVFGINRDNQRERITWDIKRSPSTQKATLAIAENDELEYGIPYFFVPVLRNMGLSEEDIYSN